MGFFESSFSGIGVPGNPGYAQIIGAAGSPLTPPAMAAVSVGPALVIVSPTPFFIAAPLSEPDGIIDSDDPAFLFRNFTTGIIPVIVTPPTPPASAAPSPGTSGQVINQGPSSVPLNR